MKEQLIKQMDRKQLVDMIYIAKSGEISKRRIKVLHVQNHTFTAYCFMKKAQRTFLINNVLSLFPVVRNERDIIG